MGDVVGVLERSGVFDGSLGRLPQAPSPSVITRTQADTFGQFRTVLEGFGLRWRPGDTLLVAG